jgi:hypothetical protein
MNLEQVPTAKTSVALKDLLPPVFVFEVYEKIKRNHEVRATTAAIMIICLG